MIFLVELLVSFHNGGLACTGVLVFFVQVDQRAISVGETRVFVEPIMKSQASKSQQKQMNGKKATATPSASEVTPPVSSSAAPVETKRRHDSVDRKGETKRETKSSGVKKRIGIVGSGIAGLAAASKLVEEGACSLPSPSFVRRLQVYVASLLLTCLCVSRT